LKVALDYIALDAQIVTGRTGRASGIVETRAMMPQAGLSAVSTSSLTSSRTVLPAGL